jgi:hypothetical protein
MKFVVSAVVGFMRCAPFIGLRAVSGEALCACDALALLKLLAKGRRVCRREASLRIPALSVSRSWFGAIGVAVNRVGAAPLCIGRRREA